MNGSTGGGRSAPRMIGAMLAMLIASGCSGLRSDSEPAQTYVLRANPGAPEQPLPNARTLRIARTIASPGLDSDRIAVMRADHRIDYYAASRWAAPVPDLVEALAVDTMRGTGAWAAVNDSQGAFPADYFLQIAIRRFETDYTAAATPKIHVILDCSIGRSAGRELIANFVAEGTAVASANRLGAVVTAFEEATRTALSALAVRGVEAARNEAPAVSESR